jgi:FHS family glucose/mannose:H+ symporter-like MFS transporter
MERVEAEWPILIVADTHHTTPALAVAVAVDDDAGVLASPGARKALGGFFLSGFLLAFLGAIIPSWGHHLLSDYWMVGLYFVALVAGLVVAARVAPALFRRWGIGKMLAISCGAASLALLMLAFFSPPFAAWWRLPGILLLGCAAGVLHTAIFQAISPVYRHDPAATVNLAGALFGLGCFSVALLISQMFYFYTSSAIQVWLALVPGFCAIGYARSRFAACTAIPVQATPVPASHVPASHVRATHSLLEELRSPSAVLFSLVLFFQFGNEWAIAGWLPLYLSQRLGLSPSTSILILAMYWLALLVGRIAAQWILPRVRHSRLLGTSVLAAVFACVILIATDNLFGAVSGVLLLGAAFAPIYPLVVEKIGGRFPDYQPGVYNGIFSFAIAGGLLAPSTLGYWAGHFGVRAVMALPLAGSLIVFVLLVLTRLEARLHASATPSRPE